MSILDITPRVCGVAITATACRSGFRGASALSSWATPLFKKPGAVYFAVGKSWLYQQAKTGAAVISGAQVRAARAFLGWTARALAVKASVPIFTIEWIEGEGKLTGSDRKALAAVQQTLEAAGVEFIGSVGVQLHPKKRRKVSAADKNVRRLQHVVKRTSGLL